MTRFPQWIASIDHRFKLGRSYLVHTEKWQGLDISKKPEMATHEIRHLFIRIPLDGEERLHEYQRDIAPNLPWADDHFTERVCGFPINPGVQWSKWPYAHSASKFLNEEGQFNHNYMERYWPKHAGAFGSMRTADEFKSLLQAKSSVSSFINTGINHPYGDLVDVVAQLQREPQTRQAILPIFFPEDTGATHGGRVPCSLSYQFMMRDGKLDVTYVIRSCDYLRHFRDDVYMTVRLLLWVLAKLRELDPSWKRVVPGEYIMLITSLHLFRNDFNKMFGEQS